ncbi:MAG: 50S ribosomal protein L25 [Patescibacteria group bacterium]
MDLFVRTRNILGKKTKSLRNEGLIPAELFGRGLKNRHLSVGTKEFKKIYEKAGEHTLVSVVTEEGEKLPVLITEVTREPISEQLLSIDLHQVRMDEKIQAKVPIEFSGIAPAIKNGFVVVNVLNEIEIEALPNHIPQKFEVDLSILESPGQGIYVKDLKKIKEVKLLVPEEAVIVTVTEKKAEEVIAPPVATEETAATTTETPASEEKPSANSPL